MSSIYPETKNFDQLPDSALLPCKVVAQILGLHRATIWRMVQDGRLDTVKLGARATRFKVGQVRELIGGGSC